MAGLRRVGVYGGTFDPVHLGHIQVATRVRDKLALDAVLLIPCGIPVHRPAPIASAEQRVAMVKRAISGEPTLELDTREACSTAPSYTFDTLMSLREERQDTSWHLLTGADAFLSLPGWKNWRQLFSLSHLIVVTRPGCRLEEDNMDDALREEWHRRRVDDPSMLATQREGAICCLDLDTDDISSSRARDLIKTGGDTNSILHPAVADYIMQQRLYASGGTA